MSVIQGKNLVVSFVSGSTTPDATSKLFCATNCTLTLNHGAINATCKDGGSWQGNIPGVRSWEITTDNLYDPDASNGFVDVSDLILDDNNECTVVFGQDNAGEIIWYGEAMISTCNLNGAIEEVATWSATFVGNGALTRGVKS